jgi:hypothetical protein
MRLWVPRGGACELQGSLAWCTAATSPERRSPRLWPARPSFRTGAFSMPAPPILVVAGVPDDRRKVEDILLASEHLVFCGCSTVEVIDFELSGLKWCLAVFAGPSGARLGGGLSAVDFLRRARDWGAHRGVRSKPASEARSTGHAPTVPRRDPVSPGGRARSTHRRTRGCRPDDLHGR